MYDAQRQKQRQRCKVAKLPVKRQKAVKRLQAIWQR